MGKKHKKLKSVKRKEMTKKINNKTNSENYSPNNSEVTHEQQNNTNYPKDIQGLFKRLGIE